MKFKMKQISAAVLLLSGAASAQAQIYKVVLSAANEIPAIASNGSGLAIISLNPTTHELRVSANFTGLVGNTTASHVHCCAVQPANAGVATVTPTFPGLPLGVTAGAFDNTFNMTLANAWNPAFVTANGGTTAGAEAAFISGVAAGNSYLNIHSSFAPGGEIRGTLVRNSFAPNASVRSAGVAAALDSLGAGTGAVNDRLMALALMNPAAQKSAMEMLLPASSFAVQNATSNALFADFDQIGSRMQSMRMDAGSAQSGLWVKALDIIGEQEPVNGYAGFNVNGWDFTMGYDRQLAAGLTVGLSLGMTEHSLDFADQAAGSSTKISTALATLYASKSLGRAYVDGMVSYGQHDIEYSRNVSFTSYAQAHPDSEQWGARIGTGITVDLATGLTVTPQAHVDWVGLDQDAYQEFGGGGLALSVADQSSKRLRSSLGAQFDWNSSGTMSPYVRGFWNHDYKDGAIMQTASFNAGGSSFSDTSQSMDRNSFSMGIGVNFHLMSSMAAAIAYDRTSSNNYKADIFHAKLLWSF